jgi:hypothetical protein
MAKENWRNLKMMSNILFCKDCKGCSQSIFLHGEIKFQKVSYNPYKVNFLRVDSVEYGFDLVGFFGNLAISPPRKLNNRSFQSHNRNVSVVSAQ